MTDLANIDLPDPPSRHLPAALLQDNEIRLLYRVAGSLALSQMFPDAKDADAAFAKILIGRDLGLSPTQSLMGIHLVEGKPEIAAVTLGSFVRRLGFDFRVREHTGEVCKIEFLTGEGESLGVSEFTIEDAKRANLVKPRGGWEKYPRNMLFARAMSNGVKWYVPEATGGLPVYAEDEIQHAPSIGQGTGQGEPLGLELGPKVEAVIERATELGHAGYSDRATAEVTLGDQPPQFVEQWCKDAMATLDVFEQTRLTEGEAAGTIQEEEK